MTCHVCSLDVHVVSKAIYASYIASMRSSLGPAGPYSGASSARLHAKQQQHQQLPGSLLWPQSACQWLPRLPWQPNAVTVEFGILQAQGLAHRSSGFENNARWPSWLLLSAAGRLQLAPHPLCY